MKRNTVERAIKTETDKRTEIKKEWASSVGLCSRHKLQHPHHVKVSQRGPNKAKTASEQQSRKAERCWEYFLESNIVERAIQAERDTENGIKSSRQAPLIHTTGYES